MSGTKTNKETIFAFVSVDAEAKADKLSGSSSSSKSVIFATKENVHFCVMSPARKWA